jgi:phospholipase D1/2
MGDRDSEIGLVISDSEMMDTVFNGQPMSVSKFAHAFRCSLFQEHLGLSGNSGVTEDPICEDSWALWLQRSQMNTDIYRAVFPGAALRALHLLCVLTLLDRRA